MADATQGLEANFPGRQQITSGTAVVAAAEVTPLAAPGAGLRLVIGTIVLGNGNAVASNVDIKQGAGGTVRATLVMAASQAATAYRFFPPLRWPANTAVVAQGSAAGDGRMTVTAWIEFVN